MHSGISWNRSLALLGLAGALALPFRTDAALSIVGPTSAAPGETVSFTIELDTAPDAAGVDELTLQMSFDAAVLIGQDATAGPLLASGSFIPNAATGAATHSFLSTLTTLGPGTLATWTFQLSPSATPQTTVLGATLMTFVIDNELTAELSSAPFMITVVPEPSVWASLLLGIATLGALRRRQLRQFV